MTKKGIFSCMNLDRDHILPDIKEFCCKEFSRRSISDLELINKSNNQYRYKIKGDDAEFWIDLYFRDDGTTTIQPKVGGRQDFSIKLADYILSKVPYGEVKNTSYSVKASDEILKFVLDYLEELDDVVQTYKDTTGVNGYKLYQYQSKIADRLTLKYFTNNTLQIQGKPMYLHQETTCLLSEYFPFDEVVKRQEEIFSVPLDPDEIRHEIQQLLPTAYAVLDELLIKILTASVSFKKIDIKLPDYSSFAFPALRVLEGYLKYLFGTKSITVDREFYCFEPDKGGIFTLKTDIRNKIGCTKTCKAMETVYNHLNKHRHRLFHAEVVAAATRIISTKAEANQLILETIKLIEESNVSINTP